MAVYGQSPNIGGAASSILFLPSDTSDLYKLRASLHADEFSVMAEYTRNNRN